MYLAKSPLFLKLLYPSLIWNKSRSEKIIYLTFDDGPIPDVTNFVLNELNKYSAKATFFCIGDNIVKHPDIFLHIKEQGHQIGNHTFNHLKGWNTANDLYLQNILNCQQLTQTSLFRPPYGRIKKSQIRMLQSDSYPSQSADAKPAVPRQIIMWDVLSADYDETVTAEKCYKNVIDNATNGSIVVFHDSQKAFPRLQYALPKALQYFKENGYIFGSL